MDTALLPVLAHPTSASVVHPPLDKERPTPRPYQLEAVQKSLQQLSELGKAIIVMATGTGKAITLATLVRDYVGRGKRALVLAHTEELIDQLADTLAWVVGVPVSIEMAERKATNTMVVTASIQTMSRRKQRFDPDHFGLVVVDECFVAGTPIFVDNKTTRPIEEIQPGDKVLTHDIATGKLVQRKVVRLYRKPAKRLVVVRTKQELGFAPRAITCTPNHPFWVPSRGGEWIAAEALEPGDWLMVVSERGKKRVCQVDSVSSVHVGSDGVPVYNFEVEDTHTYFADGVHVHNCHHSAANTYKSVLSHFGKAHHFGCTATPDRGDGVGLQSVFHTVSYSFDILQAVSAGVLVRPKGKIVRLNVDLDKVHTVAGDLAQDELAALLEEDSAIQAVAEGIASNTGERPTIVFASSVAHAHALAAKLNELKGAPVAFAIDGGMDKDERRARVLAFRQGKYQYLTNCNIATEGVDIPRVSCVAIARPTKSRARYVQCAGRGLRLFEGKSDCLILDFVGNTKKHSLVSCIDLVGEHENVAVREAAKRTCEQQEFDCLVAIEASRGRYFMQVLVSDPKASKKADEPNLFRKMHKSASDAADFFGVSLGSAVEGAPPPGEAQIKVLTVSGIDPTGLDRWQAHKLVTQIAERKRLGLCSWKQAKLLLRHGIENAADLSPTVAKQAIDRIAANDWKPLPPNVLRAIVGAPQRLSVGS